MSDGSDQESYRWSLLFNLLTGRGAGGAEYLPVMDDRPEVLVLGLFVGVWDYETKGAAFEDEAAALGGCKVVEDLRTSWLG